MSQWQGESPNPSPVPVHRRRWYSISTLNESARNVDSVRSDFGMALAECEPEKRVVPVGFVQRPDDATTAG